MIETFLLASSLAVGCVERDARSVSEFIRQKGQPILECPQQGPDVFVDQQIVVQDGRLTIAYRFDSPFKQNDLFLISDCADIEPVSLESNQGITQDLICDGATYRVDIAEGAVVVANEEETVFRHEVGADTVTVNGMSYVLPSSR